MRKATIMIILFALCGLFQKAHAYSGVAYTTPIKLQYYTSQGLTNTCFFDLFLSNVSDADVEMVQISVYNGTNGAVLHVNSEYVLSVDGGQDVVFGSGSDPYTVRFKMTPYSSLRCKLVKQMVGSATTTYSYAVISYIQEADVKHPLIGEASETHYKYAGQTTLLFSTRTLLVNGGNPF